MEARVQLAYHGLEAGIGSESSNTMSGEFITDSATETKLHDGRR